MKQKRIERLMQKAALLVGLLSVACFPMYARGRLSGRCQDGNVTVKTSGQNSANKVQGSFSGCTITVYLAGTVTLATLYSDNSGTAQSNPFTLGVGVDLWSFYADNLAYDVRLSGGGILAPFTIGAITVNDPANVTQELSDLAFQIEGFTFGTMCASAVVSHSTIVISRSWGSGTIGCAADLRFISGGILVPTAGSTITLTGSFTAPANLQVFDLTASGSVLILPATIQVVSPLWFDTTCSALGVNAASTSLVGAGTIRLPVKITCHVAGATLSVKNGQILDLNGSIISSTWTGFAVTPALSGSNYAVNVQVRNGEIDTTGMGCIDVASSSSIYENLECGLRSTGTGQIGYRLPGQAAGTGPYHNVFILASTQSVPGDATSFGFKFTCASTRCPNDNTIIGGRQGNGGTGWYLDGEGNVITGAAIAEGNEHWALNVGTQCIGCRMIGGTMSGEGTVTSTPGAINIQAGARQTGIIDPRQTSFGSGVWLANADTTALLMGVVDTDGVTVIYSFPDLSDRNLTDGPVCSTVGHFYPCFPMSPITYENVFAWNSGVGNTSPFYVPLSGHTGPYGAASAAYTNPFPDRTYLQTFTFADISLSNNTGADIVVALTENGTAEAFTCTIPTGSQECVIFATYKKQSGTAGLAWKFSWSGSTGLGAAVRISIVASAR